MLYPPYDDQAQHADLPFSVPTVSSRGGPFAHASPFHAVHRQALSFSSRFPVSLFEVTTLFELSAHEHSMLVGQFFTKVEFCERVNDLTKRNSGPNTLMKIIDKDLHK
jgi:hypothetical protein